jgi:hypothetical protein
LDLGFKNAGFAKDLNLGFSSDVGFWFFFGFQFFVLRTGFSGLWIRIDYRSTNGTNIRYSASQHKRIIARFLRFCFYDWDRKNTYDENGVLRYFFGTTINWTIL